MMKDPATSLPSRKIQTLLNPTCFTLNDKKQTSSPVRQKRLLGDRYICLVPIFQGDSEAENQASSRVEAKYHPQKLLVGGWTHQPLWKRCEPSKMGIIFPPNILGVKIQKKNLWVATFTPGFKVWLPQGFTVSPFNLWVKNCRFGLPGIRIRMGNNPSKVCGKMGCLNVSFWPN